MLKEKKPKELFVYTVDVIEETFVSVKMRYTVVACSSKCAKKKIGRDVNDNQYDIINYEVVKINKNDLLSNTPMFRNDIDEWVVRKTKIKPPEKGDKNV